MLTFVGRRGVYRLPITQILDWDRPVRGYPNAFVSSGTAKEIDEEWREWEPKSPEELAPAFKSDAGRHMDRAKPLLLWAAALTALCIVCRHKGIPGNRIVCPFQQFRHFTEFSARHDMTGRHVNGKGTGRCGGR